MSDDQTPPPQSHPRVSLDYLVPTEPQGPHWGVQLITGVATWSVVAGVTFACVLQNFITTAGYLFVTLFVAMIVLAVFLRNRFGWKLFVPGVLIGVALTCLVGFGICANGFSHI